MGRDTHFAGFAAQLAAHLEQHGAQAVGDLDGVELGFGHIVNLVNDSKSL